MVRGDKVFQIIGKFYLKKIEVLVIIQSILIIQHSLIIKTDKGSIVITGCAHPASMTHASMSQPERKEAGISDELVRISVGCKDYEDLSDDLNQALDKI